MAKFTIAELVAKFTGDTSGLEKAVDSAGISISGFAKKSALAVAAAGTALGTLAFKTMGAVGANNDLAKSLGISYKSLVDLKLVADESGASIQQVGASIGIMQRNLVDASAGSGAAYDALNSLGIKINEIISLSPDQQFGAIAQKIAEIENPTLRNAVAMDIFGRSGKEIVQIFDGYNQKIAEASKFNEKFNVSLSQVDVEKLDAAEEATKRISVAMSGLANTVTVLVAPGIEAIADGIISILELLPKLQSGVKKYSDKFTDTFLLKDKGYSEITFPKQKSVLEKLQERVNNTGIKPVLSSSSKSSSETIGGSFPLITKAAADASESVTRLNGKLLETVSVNVDLKNSVADTFSGFVSSVGRGENAMESLRRTALTVIDDIIQNMFRMSFGGSTTGGGIGSTIAQGLFSLIGGSSPSFVLGKTAPPRKPFANGGVVSGSQLFPIGGNMGQMGEKGPEAIMPLVRGAGGKLGVANHGGGSGKNVVVNNNFSLGVQQTVRAEIMRMLPDINRASVGAVAEAQNRNILRA